MSSTSLTEHVNQQVNQLNMPCRSCGLHLYRTFILDGVLVSRCLLQPCIPKDGVLRDGSFDVHSLVFRDWDSGIEVPVCRINTQLRFVSTKPHTLTESPVVPFKQPEDHAGGFQSLGHVPLSLRLAQNALMFIVFKIKVPNALRSLA